MSEFLNPKMQVLLAEIEAKEPETDAEKGVALYFDKVNPYFGHYTGADSPVGIPFTVPELYDEEFWNRPDADELLAEWQKTTQAITTVFRGFCIGLVDDMLPDCKGDLACGFLSDKYMAVMDKLFKVFKVRLDSNYPFAQLVRALAGQCPILSETSFGLFYNGSLIESTN